MTKKIRKIYSQEFKGAAVKLVLEGKQTVPEAAKSLGIGESTLYKWVEQAKPDDEKDNRNIKLLDENKRLRTELTEVKKKLALTEEHREILKKAAGYFAAQTL